MRLFWSSVQLFPSSSWFTPHCCTSKQPNLLVIFKIGFKQYISRLSESFSLGIGCFFYWPLQNPVSMTEAVTGQNERQQTFAEELWVSLKTSVERFLETTEMQGQTKYLLLRSLCTPYHICLYPYIHTTQINHYFISLFYTPQKNYLV